MSVSHDAAVSSRETRVLPGDLGTSGGAAPVGGDKAAAGAEGGSEESAGESEAWAASVPPVGPEGVSMTGSGTGLVEEKAQETFPVCSAGMGAHHQM